MKPLWFHGIPKALQHYQKKRKRRVEEAGARKNGAIWHSLDGDEQEEKDALMKARDGETQINGLIQNFNKDSDTFTNGYKF